MTLWEILSWLANCQLFLNDVNIVGVLWAVTLTYFAYKRFSIFQKIGFSSFGLNLSNSQSVVLPFLLGVIMVVWMQSIIDLGLITPIALTFGRWIEIVPVRGPLTILSFLTLYWNIIAYIIIIGIFFWTRGIYKLLHFTKQTFFITVSMVVFYVIIMETFGIWNYNLLKDPIRTTFFWSLYPEIRILWAFFFVSILKKPNFMYEALSIKEYYIIGEKYDWVSDPRWLEKIFHSKREKQTVKFIKKYGVSSNVLDVGCGTGRITRNLTGNVLGLDINEWNLERAKVNAPNARFMLGDCESMDEIPSGTMDLVVFTETLEHLPNPHRALDEVRRVMKFGGIAVITVPTQSLIWRFRKYLTSTHPHSEPFHRNIGKADLLELLKDFKILEIKKIVYGLTWVAVVQK